MKLLNLFICLLLTIITPQISGRSNGLLKQCEMAVEFAAAGIDQESLPNYVCIAEKVSYGDPFGYDCPKGQGSCNWGIFLISGSYWCTEFSDKPGKGCNVRCQDLTSRNVATAVHCAQEIVRVQGYKAWSAWDSLCKNKLPDLKHCFN